MTCLPIATQAEAEAGIVNDKSMTPLRTKQAIDALGASVSLRDFGADPTGATSSTAAFLAALAVADRIVGVQGDTYLIGSQVSVPAGKEIIGNGASLKIGNGVIGLRLSGSNCKVSGWKILGNGGLYAVLNESDNNSFTDNVCSGNVGHFFFSLNAKHVTATRNSIEGLSAPTEITTAIVCETCKHIVITDNQFNNIPVGWGVQIRDSSEDFTLANNSFLQTMWTDSVTATGGQTVFNFTLGSVCLLKKIQINGLPLSSAGNYTITGSGPAYTVTFVAGRTGGDVCKLVGYRGAENIQINSGSKQGVITGNNVNGTGDSGIIVHGSAVTVTANSIRNCGYAGIAVYGDQDEVSVTGNQITDCSQLDDGLSSPDDPLVNSVFAGGLLLSGNNATATGNVFTNDSGTMRYGIRVNKTNMALRTDGSSTISLASNIFKGSYVDGKIFAPNDQFGERINSISVDGSEIVYPQQIDLDQAWTFSPYAPVGTDYFGVGGFNQYTLRDPTIKQGGTASMKTQPNSYVDFNLLAAGMFKNCNITITFWAKNASGSSYVSVFTDLGGLLFPLTAEITDTAWKQYTISFPLTDNLESKILLRVGGNTGFANVQHIQISGKRL
ncbi:right-handed parallel beta-helix repeat-containing protein [Sphingopyxis fribergensis]